jgi:hypothetical protein
MALDLLGMATAVAAIAVRQVSQPFVGGASADGRYRPGDCVVGSSARTLNVPEPVWCSL